MSNSYQRASSQRKLFYFGAIVALFVVTFFVRGIVALPGAEVKNQATPELAVKTIGLWSIQKQSDRLELNEMSQGEVELTGSAIRLLLTGSRGLAICGLWMSAQEKQIRQEWNELDLTVKSITKLQPHFVTPWLFQSWNLSYNVSVEMDRLTDMYYYIARGISLLAEGESINRNNPDMRYTIGFYYQNKFTVSDKVTTLRCLFQLSCMTKEDRDYRALLKGGEVDPAAFKKFCERYPQFVRRLRETAIRIGKDSKGKDLPLYYLVKTPKEVVDFLRENEDVPNRYRVDDPRALEDRLKQFPVLPSYYLGAEQELNPERPIGDGEASAIRAAKSWFHYANEVIPPPNPEPAESDLNYQDPERKRRLPKQPGLIIFRQGPQRAQSYIAEQLAKEGWFDSEPWIVDLRRDANDRWFEDDVEIKPTGNSREAWENAYELWASHGRANGLNLDDAKLLDYRRRAEAYARQRGFPVESGEFPNPRPDELNDPTLRDSIEATRKLRIYKHNLSVTNYEFFLYQAEAEKDPDMIAARKMLYEADRERRNNHVSSCLALYREALGIQWYYGLWGKMKLSPWQKILMKFTRYRNARDTFVQEIYEQQMNYLYQYRDVNKLQMRMVPLWLFDQFRLAGDASRVSPAFFALGDQILYAKIFPSLGTIEPIWPGGPFDGDDPDGNSWIPDHVKNRVRTSLGILKPEKQEEPKK
ncbi:MAG: hypothetical protein K8T89_07775 [Planctomycetes bacterium]|nr:hypothetical protein [Planctomycetota bacterium]